MVSSREMRSRVRDFLSYSWPELAWLAVAAIVTGFIFSFRDWGDVEFEAGAGLIHLLLLSMVSLLSFLVRFTAQKYAALSYGYLAESRVWMVGLIIALIVAFISQGMVALVLVGGMSVVFMSKQRIGEFRYGFSYKQNALIALWGIVANLLLAWVFGSLLFLFEGSYLFEKGMWINLTMGFFAFLPLVQMDGLSLFFGSRMMYLGGLIVYIASALLIGTQTKWGLVAMGVAGLVASIVSWLIWSEK